MTFEPLPGCRLAAEIDAGDRDPADILGRIETAIAEREPVIGAFEFLDLTTVAEGIGKASGPLFGLPVGIKDVFDTADMPTGYGSPIYEGHRPVADAAIVSMIRRAGGTIPGKTVTTEFAFFNPARTRNPVNPGHTPGGSSSGSAAAVAAGMVPFAIGTQTGGSIIRPAAFCGIAGYKPSFRMLPTVGLKTFSWSLDTVGFFAAGIDDVAFLAAAVTGRDLRTDETDPGAPRIAVAHTHLWHEATGEMRQALATAGHRAAAAGARVTEIELAGLFSEAFAAHQVIQDHQAALALAYEFDTHRDRLSPILRDTLDYGRTISVNAYDEARRTARAARLLLRDTLADFDVLLTPSAPGAAPEGLGSTGSSIFNRLWTLMGVPTLNVPGLRAASGLPLGMQVIGRHGRDRQALLAAKWLETALAAGQR